MSNPNTTQQLETTSDCILDLLPALLDNEPDPMLSSEEIARLVELFVNVEP